MTAANFALWRDLLRKGQMELVWILISRISLRVFKTFYPPLLSTSFLRPGQSMLPAKLPTSDVSKPSPTSPPPSLLSRSYHEWSCSLQVYFADSFVFGFFHPQFASWATQRSTSASTDYFQIKKLHLSVQPRRVYFPFSLSASSKANQSVQQQGLFVFSLSRRVWPVLRY